MTTLRGLNSVQHLPSMSAYLDLRLVRPMEFPLQGVHLLLACSPRPQVRCRLTTDRVNGFAVTVDVNLDGTTTLTNFVATPERGSFVLLLTAMVFALIQMRCRLRFFGY